MPKIHVERSISIAAPAERVKQLTTDFNEWPAWPPWLCMEPEAKVEVYGTPGQTDHGYRWTGQLVGEGEMQTSSIANGVQELDLTFIKPFRSKARVMLQVEPGNNDDTTNVTWHMHSSLPFFMFFLTRTMTSMIGMDYERGLRMLKEYAETGNVDSSTEVAGIVRLPSIQYVGVEAQSSMSELSSSMQTTMSQAGELATATKLNRTPILAGAIYNSLNINNQHCKHTAFVPLESSQQTTAQNLPLHTIPSGIALKVIHRGSYTNLGNAWSTAMSYQRYKKLKPLKAQPPFECYMNDPDNTAAEDLLTEIFIPLKGRPD